MIKSDFTDQEELHKLNALSAAAHLYVKHVCIEHTHTYTHVKIAFQHFH